MLAARQRAELAVHERNDLAGEVVGVVADRRRIHVLVAAQRREAVREDDDHRAHPALVDEARGALRNVIAERLPAHVRQAGAGEADEIVEHREAPLVALVILRRQPYTYAAGVRIAEGITLE